jgi:uncharacterized protein YbjT (DUF2867 family)
MKNILITGATGNVGLEVIKSLQKINTTDKTIAGVKDLVRDKAKFEGLDVEFYELDFANSATYLKALKNIDYLFLLRPPQISEVGKYFEPFIKIAQECGVNHIVFLSVQGVEKSSIIPHHKIEKLIGESGIPFTFLRPAYFMQNFSTTLKQDLVKKNLIFLPAGKAKFTLIDVEDIGKVAAKILTNPTEYVNKSYELTCYEKLNFEEMADKLSVGLGRKITYESPNLLKFYFQKSSENMAFGFIMVMIMLHFLPRFQKVPDNTDWVEKITGEKPKSFDEFIADNQAFLK